MVARSPSFGRPKLAMIWRNSLREGMKSVAPDSFTANLVAFVRARAWRLAAAHCRYFTEMAARVRQVFR